MVGASAFGLWEGICLVEKNVVIFLHLLIKVCRREFFLSRATLGGRRVVRDAGGRRRSDGNCTPHAR